MKYFLLSFLYSFSIIAQANPSGQALHTMEGEAAVASQRKGNEVLVITAQERATDIKHVFEFTQKKQTGNFELVMTDGKVFSSILNIDVMPGGTLMIIQINSMKGQVYEVIRTENVQGVKID